MLAEHGAHALDGVHLGAIFAGTFIGGVTLTGSLPVACTNRREDGQR